MIKRIDDIKKKFLSNEIIHKGSSALILKTIGSACGYGFLLLVTRTSGADTWGVFALCFALLNISSMVGRIGIDTALIKYIATFKDSFSNVKAIYLKAISIVSFSTFFTSIILYFSADFIADFVFQKEFLAPYIKIISFVILPFSIITVNAQSLRGLKDIKGFSIYQHVAKFFISIILYLIIIKFFNFQKYVEPLYAFSISLFVVMGLSSIPFIKIIKQNRSSDIKISKKELLKTSFPMMLATSVLLIMSWVDTIMIGIFCTETEVGIYNGTLRLAMAIGIVLGAVNSITAPKISETYNSGDIEKFKKIVRSSTRIIFFSTLPIFFVFITFPKFILSILGPDFVVAKSVFIILLLGKMIASMSGSVGVILQMVGKEKVFQNIVSIALIFNIILNLLLIPKMGISGAAIASAFSIIFWNISAVIYIYRKYNVSTFYNFLNSD